MPTDMKCPICGKITRVPQARIRANKSGIICCSKACNDVYRQRRFTANCKTCGKPFERRQSNGGEFCSRSCALTWRWNQSPGKEKHKQKATERNRATSPKPTREILYRLHVGEGLSAPRIADRYRVQPQTVRKWLRLDGIALIPAEPRRPERKVIPLPRKPIAMDRPRKEPKVKEPKVKEPKVKEPKVKGNFVYQPPPRDVLSAMYEMQRLTMRKIGNHFGVSSSTVGDWLKAYRIQSRPSGTGLAQRGIEPPTCEELTRMIHTDRLTYGQIAVRYGVDQSAIQYWLNKHGIERPPTWFEEHSAPETLAAMRSAYEAGASLEDIGQHWGGVVGTTVNVLFRAHGVPLRKDGWKGGQRFACQDGHLVRSTYERRVDDWLHEHGIKHTYEPSLPFSPMHKADFQANGWYIEVWGVTNNAAYQERKRRKLELYTANNAPLVEIPYHAFFRQSKDLWIRRLHQCLTCPS